MLNYEINSYLKISLTLNRIIVALSKGDLSLAQILFDLFPNGIFSSHLEVDFYWIFPFKYFWLLFSSFTLYKDAFDCEYEIYKEIKFILGIWELICIKNVFDSFVSNLENIILVYF